MRSLSSLIIVVHLLTACSVNGRLVREASEACSSHSFGCSPELAAIAPLETLKANDRELTVNCELSIQLDDAYRETCARRLTQLVETLSARWSSVLSPINLSDMTLADEQTCIDTFIPGREGADCEIFYIRAKVPLRWVQSK